MATRRATADPATHAGPTQVRPTGRICDITGLPLVDARDLVSSVDWSAVPGPRADDVGLELEDGTRLTTADEVDAYFGFRGRT